MTDEIERLAQDIEDNYSLFMHVRRGAGERVTISMGIPKEMLSDPVLPLKMARRGNDGDGQSQI